MLDYAANGVKYWPISELRADFEHHAVGLGIDPAALIEDLTPGTDPEEFWSDVERNLRSGHVRMVFVADRLPPELVRIIEFLNEQMSPARSSASRYSSSPTAQPACWSLARSAPPPRPRR